MECSFHVSEQTLDLVDEGSMMLLIVPLKASFLQTYVLDEENDHYLVFVSPGAGYSLLVVYLFLAIFPVLLSFIMCDRPTRLKWDPVSIADQLALMAGSNILSVYHGLEFADPREWTRILEYRFRCNWAGVPRLGYWKHRTDSIWHGLACLPPLTGNLRTPSMVLLHYWLILH